MDMVQGMIRSYIVLSQSTTFDAHSGKLLTTLKHYQIHVGLQEEIDALEKAGVDLAND